MADDVDNTQEKEEVLLQFKLKERKPVGPEATGECLWCEAELPAGHRWCDADCRDLWELKPQRGTPWLNRDLGGS